MFWTRYVKKYLPALQESKRRNKIIRNIIINVVDIENIPKAFLPLACIDDLHVGNDGIVRSHKIKLSNNISMAMYQVVPTYTG